VLPADDVERHALDAVGPRLGEVLGDGVGVGAVLQGGAQRDGVQPDAGAERDQLVDLPHMPALLEVRGEEPLDQLELRAVLLGEVQRSWASSVLVWRTASKS